MSIPLHRADPPEVIPDDDTPRVPRGVTVTVYLEDQDPFEVRVTNRERIGFEKTAAKHKEWPARDQAPNFAMTFVTWAAAKRAGRTPLTFDQWSDALEDWDIEEGEGSADPTR